MVSMVKSVTIGQGTMQEVAKIRSVEPRVTPPAVGTKGIKLYNDEHGEWRSVPGFPQTTLIVSSKGLVRCKPRRDRSLGLPYLPSQHPEGYRHVTQDAWSYRICHLVLWAFHGGPLDGETADHIAKYDGDFMRERGDDRAENLRWATKVEQSSNRTVKQTQRRSLPVLARHESWPVYCPSRQFSSCLDAATELGLNQGNIANVLGTARAVHSTGGWTFAWGEPNEPQTDLVTEADGVERWAFVGDRCRAKVSTHGRYQTMKGRGTNWGPRRTPMPTRGTVYATLRVDGRLIYMHQLVWQAFGDRALVGNETIDHKDRDTSHNCISNLRPATKEQQRRNQGKRVRE